MTDQQQYLFDCLKDKVWDAFIRFGGGCNVYKLPDGTYVHILI